MVGIPFGWHQWRCNEPATPVVAPRFWDRAAALFVQLGYHNVSLNDLIAGAGYPFFKGALCQWFPPKDALTARTPSAITPVESGRNDGAARERAVDALTSRLKLHGLAVDRVLGLPDGSVAVRDRARVEAMVAHRP